VDDITTEVDTRYNKQMREYILNPLKDHGFKKYKSVNIARITKDSLFQVINFQKEAYGSKTFTANVTIRPLFIPHKYLTLSPGERLGYFTYGYDKWWSFIDETISNESFNEVKAILFDHVLPMFNDLISSEHLLEEYYNSKYVIGWHPTLGWRYHDIAFLYLDTKNYYKAKEYLYKASDEFSSDDTQWANEAKTQCEELIILIENERNSIAEFLINQKNITLSNLKLDKW
jgi:hypothetical protein